MKLEQTAIYLHHCHFGPQIQKELEPLGLNIFDDYDQLLAHHKKSSLKKIILCDNPTAIPSSWEFLSKMEENFWSEGTSLLQWTHNRLGSKSSWIDQKFNIVAAPIERDESSSLVPSGTQLLGAQQFFSSPIEKIKTDKGLPLVHKAIGKDHPKIPALFLDRDGVIIKDKYYPKDFSEAEFIHPIIELIQFARSKNFKVFCLTNQSGVARAKFTEQDYRKFENSFLQALEKKEASLDAIFSSFYHPEGENQKFAKESLSRKPMPGMFLECCQQYGIDPELSLMIGDKVSDDPLTSVGSTLLIQGDYDLGHHRPNAKVFASFSELTDEAKKIIDKTSSLLEEGVIKFDCRFNQQKLSSSPELEDLIHLRNRLFNLGHIGVTEEGIGYGNVSTRINKTFISGSQTGGTKNLGIEGFSQIDNYDFQENWLECSGETKASSESLTHCMIYDSDPSVHCVIHIHSEKLWRKYKEVLPTSYSSYGSVEQAEEVERLVKAPSKYPIIIMAGHFEGILIYGETIESAFQTLETLTAQEIELGKG